MSATNSEGKLSPEIMEQFAEFVVQEITEWSGARGCFRLLEQLYDWKPTSKSQATKLRQALELDKFVDSPKTAIRLLDVRKKCSEIWDEKEIEHKEIAEFVIKEWGRIPVKKGTDFSEVIGAPELDKNWDGKTAGRKAISTFSKVASFVRPERYYVYDSRVSFVLRLFWRLCFPNKKNLCPFEQVSSRSSEVKRALRYLDVKTAKGASSTSYQTYCDLIRRIAFLYTKVDKGVCRNHDECGNYRFSEEKACTAALVPHLLEMTLFVMASDFMCPAQFMRRLELSPRPWEHRDHA